MPERSLARSDTSGLNCHQKKLSTKQEEDDLLDLRSTDNISKFPGTSSSCDVDNFKTTHRLLRSFGCRNPLAFLSRFSIANIVYWLDQAAGEIAAGADIHNPPGYLWRLLEQAETTSNARNTDPTIANQLAETEKTINKPPKKPPARKGGNENTDKYFAGKFGHLVQGKPQKTKEPTK